MVEGRECGDKLVHERVASVLPFKVLEAAEGKPLRISGVALAVGLSRNLNVYTAEELQAFASKLVGAPMYIEHVAVPNAAGKVTKAFYDSASRCLMYEAEVHDAAIADKIRKGIIQHVSVGADYEAVDVVGGKVPHGLHNAELSLVAVPGVPEANIQVLERLRESLASGKRRVKLSPKMREVLEPLGLEFLQCVFCGQPGEYLVSVCTSCGDNAAAAAIHGGQVFDSLGRLPLKEAAGDLPSHFTAFKVRFRCYGANPCERCKALNGKEFIYGTEPEVPLHDNCECGYEIVERLTIKLIGVEKLEEKELERLAEKVAEKLGGVSSREVESLKAKLAEAEQDSAEKQAQVERSQKYGIGIKQDTHVTKPAEYADIADDDFADPVNYRYPVDKDHVQGALTYFNQPDNRADYSAEERAKITAKIVGAALAAGIEVTYQAQDPAYEALPEELKAKCKGYTKAPSEAEKLAAAEGELASAKQTLEQYRKLMPGVDLLKDPPKMMPVAEAKALVEAVLPSPMVQRTWGLGPQRMCQELRRAILTLDRRAGGAC